MLDVVVVRVHFEVSRKSSKASKELLAVAAVEDLAIVHSVQFLELAHHVDEHYAGLMLNIISVLRWQTTKRAIDGCVKNAEGGAVFNLAYA